jgi:hypothetical protein
MPKVFELTLVTSKASGDLPERMGAAQLTKQHGDKWTPRGKSFSMTFSMGFFHAGTRLLEKVVRVG